MDAESLKNLAIKYKEQKDHIKNEETAKLALILPFIRMLGYDDANATEVKSEYAAENSANKGLKSPERVDFAIFTKNSIHPTIIIESKPLGTDLSGCYYQLMKYFTQNEELHYGLLTDGCKYLFYGDLNTPNKLDSEPFFEFSLDDIKTDWNSIAEFLTNFNKSSFDSNTLKTAAENIRYKNAMIKKLSMTLREPVKDPEFIKWWLKDIYPKSITAQVRERMGNLAKEAIEPAMFICLQDDVIDKFFKRMKNFKTDNTEDDSEVLVQKSEVEVQPKVELELKPRVVTVTSEKEREFYEKVRNICVRHGYKEQDIILNDTINYCNISYRKPTRWFLRYFDGHSRKNFTTRLPKEEVKAIVSTADVEDAPTVFGVSRIYISDINDLNKLDNLIIKSLEAILRK